MELLTAPKNMMTGRDVLQGGTCSSVMAAFKAVIQDNVAKHTGEVHCNGYLQMLELQTI